MGVSVYMWVGCVSVVYVYVSIVCVFVYTCVCVCCVCMCMLCVSVVCVCVYVSRTPSLLHVCRDLNCGSHDHSATALNP